MCHSLARARDDSGGALLKGTRGPDWLQLISVLALAAGIVLVATLTPVLRELLSTGIQGASTNDRYFTLGVRRAQGVHYHFYSSAIEKLSAIAPPPIHIAARVLAMPEQIGVGRMQADAQVEFYIGDYFQTLHLPVRWARAQDPRAGHTRPHGLVLTTELARRLFGTDAHALGMPVTVHNPNTPYSIHTFVVGVLPKASSFHGALDGTPASAWLDFRDNARLRGFEFKAPVTHGIVTVISNFQFAGVPVLLSVPTTMAAPQLRVALARLWQAALSQAIIGTGSGFTVYAGYTLDPVAATVTRQRIRWLLFIAYAVLIVALLNFLFSTVIHNIRFKPSHDVLHVLGQTSRRLLQDRLLVAGKVGVALLVISGCLLPLAWVLKARLTPFSVSIPATHAAVVASLVHVLAFIGGVVVLRLFVDVGSIRLLRAGRFTSSLSARFAYQIVGVVEFVLAAALVIVAATAIRSLVDKSHTDIGIFGARASIISMAPKTVPGISVPDSLAGIARAAAANDLALGAVHEAILKTEPASVTGYGPIPSMVSTYSNQATLMAEGRSAGVCVEQVDPDWVEAAGAHLVAGRIFAKTVRGNIVISLPSARELFGSAGRSIGSTVMLHMGNVYKSYTVVGVIRPFVVDASMVPCAVALTSIYGQGYDFNRNGGHFIVRPVVPDAVLPTLVDRINASLLRAGTQLRVKAITTSDRVWRQLLAPYLLQSLMYLVIALTGTLIAIGGALAQLLYAVAARRRNTAIGSALGLRPSRIYRSLMMEFLLPVLLAIVVAIVVLVWAAARFAYISGEQIAVFSVSSIGAVAMLLLVTIVVLHFPARRAARAEPAESLHEL